MRESGRTCGASALFNPHTLSRSDSVRERVAWRDGSLNFGEGGSLDWSEWYSRETRPSSGQFNWPPEESSRGRGLRHHWRIGLASDYWCRQFDFLWNHKMLTNHYSCIWVARAAGSKIFRCPQNVSESIHIRNFSWVLRIFSWSIRTTETNRSNREELAHSPSSSRFLSVLRKKEMNWRQKTLDQGKIYWEDCYQSSLVDIIS